MTTSSTPGTPAPSAPFLNDMPTEWVAIARACSTKAATVSWYCWAALNPTVDATEREDWKRGLFMILEAAADRSDLPSQFVTTVRAALSGPQPELGSAVMAPSRRSADDRLHRMLVEVGRHRESKADFDQQALVVLGLWIARALLESWKPSAQALTSLREELNRPSARWSTERTRRNKVLKLARRSLQNAIKENRQVAKMLGFGLPRPPREEEVDPYPKINREFRQRYRKLADHLTANVLQSSAGFGPLSAESIKKHGECLAARIQACSRQHLLLGLQAISHLTGEAQLSMPVILDGSQPPPGTLAWIDLLRGEMCFVPFVLFEDGARPPTGTELNYESVSPTVKVVLSPLLVDGLLGAANCALVNVLPLEWILGSVALPVHLGVDIRPGCRATVRHLQESVSLHLLEQGFHRSVVALATNSRFPVARGRHTHGVCDSHQINDAVNAVYRLLGWPVPGKKVEYGLVGSLVTPRPDAITRMINGLANRADRWKDQPPTRVTLCCEFNGVARWLSAVLALTLALPEQATYEVPQAELLSGGAVRLEHDKSVRPVPVCGFLATAVTAWRSYCGRIAERLRGVGDVESERLARQIEAHLADSTSKAPAVVITGDSLSSVGTSTWHNSVPSLNQLVENFARHFWPYRLMQRGVCQASIDTLMRSRVDLHSNGFGAPYSGRSPRRQLRSAMDATIEELALRVPRVLRSG